MAKRKRVLKWKFADIKVFVLIVYFCFLQDDFLINHLKASGGYQDRIDKILLSFLGINWINYFALFYKDFLLYNNYFRYLSLVNLTKDRFIEFYNLHCLLIDQSFLYHSIGQHYVFCFSEIWREDEDIFNDFDENFFVYTFEQSVFERYIITYDFFLVKINLTLFFRLDFFVETYRQFKYNEYLMTHPGLLDKYYYKYRLLQIYFKFDFVDKSMLKIYFISSLLRKKYLIYIFYSSLPVFRFEQNVITSFLFLSATGLNVFNAIDKGKTFIPLIKTVFNVKINSYMEFYTYKFFMMFARKYRMERWYFRNYSEIISELFRVTFQCPTLVTEMFRYYEKLFILNASSNNNLLYYFSYLDMLKFNSQNFLYKDLLESLEFRKIFRFIFCNFYQKMAFKFGDSFRGYLEPVDKKFISFQDEATDFFISYLQYFPVDIDEKTSNVFSFAFDYYICRLFDIDRLWDVNVLQYAKNSIFDFINHSRDISLLYNFRLIYSNFYLKHNILDFKVLISLFVYRDYILKLIEFSILLSNFYYFIIFEKIEFIYLLNNNRNLILYLMNNKIKIPITTFDYE